ncbi:MAG: hypothetical protein CMJ78_14660 [Planctomycetaceae bacterium]|nr:hypothetical protein [Planctomycetaceae bacterium]
MKSPYRKICVAVLLLIAIGWFASVVKVDAFEADEKEDATTQAAKTSRPWGAIQLVGKPDAPTGQDSQMAWASLTADSQNEWIMLEYKKAVIPKGVEIHESYAPGAVNKISVFNEKDDEIKAWEGQDPVPTTKSSGIAKIELKGIKFKVKKIKIYLDSPSVPDWNEIDAVGLRDGDNAIQWAVAATASSTYGTVTTPTIVVSGKRSWGEEQVLGKPDTLSAGDQQTAWASATADASREWLAVEYENAVIPKAVMIHETYNPGAVDRVTVFDPKGKEVEVWEGVDPTPRSEAQGISVIPIKVKFKITKVKIYMNSPEVLGWNEIDAVALKDADGETQWAKKASASSSFASGVSATAMPLQPAVAVNPFQQIQQMKKDIDALKKKADQVDELEQQIAELKKLVELLKKQK